MENNLLLKVEGLKTYFFSREGTLKAVDGVSFDIKRGETLGIAGESGCGKSVTAQSILRIVPQNGRITGGNILFNLNERGFINLVKLNPEGEEIRKIRGKEISMIFQEPMTSFSPVHTIGNQIMEVIMLHQALSRKEAKEKAIELLKKVGMPKPTQMIDAYPFNLSGGMRQRAMIAMALSCQPSLLIADEPTTAVDVTIQAQVLELIKELQKELNMALIIITHDLAVIAELADKVLIMYLGKNVEYASVDELFYNPKHPYTKGLLASIPKLGKGSRQRIEPISGSVPSPYEMPSGCLFHPRCPRFIPGVCDKKEPPFIEIGENHKVSCFLYKR
ncbi:ABC transporter ATP-binding protein [Candidatus Aerophobetes bacterium]|nr:ABC transporter ATP-binding protein [Candidatus Aerophobetes bacterium]